MRQRMIRYRLILIDDDEDMNVALEKLLAGHRVVHEDVTVILDIHHVDVELDEIPEQPGFWKVSEKTIRNIERVSRNGPYDLVIADFGFAEEKAKEILWGKDRSRRPSREEAKGRLLTIRDLAHQYHSHLRDEGYGVDKNNSLFLSTGDVLLRSMASRMAFDILGPVIPNRVNETKSAFANAAIDPIDPRNEFYGGDTFYHMYEPDGRDFYRQLVCAYTIRALESHVLRTLIRASKRPGISRSVFNIAIFAGSVALVGGLTQYLGGIGLSLVVSGQSIGWWILVGGVTVLAGGALLLSLYFEAFSRAVVRWVRPEKEHDD
ncbi:MAG TPA: hypothetical protein VN285_08695 [Candidatus Deferrimicrobium sp.]|nr:hypothetical protein [Candidatus Deferrimicrobium sp.]